MNNVYHEKLVHLINQAYPQLAATHRLEFKNVFGAIGGYVNGRIFVSCGAFGFALRLPPDTLLTLFRKKEAKHLRYFPNGHVKKAYAVIHNRILENKGRLRTLLKESIEYTLSR